MQDNDFDELFRSKLGGFESEPSKGTWDNIAADVVSNRQNRPALFLTGIAASILVLITAGIFIFNPSKLKNGKPDQVLVARNFPQLKVQTASPTKQPKAGIIVQEPVIALVPKNIVKRVYRQNIRATKQVAALPVVNPVESTIKQALPGVPSQPEVLAITAPPSQSLISTNLETIHNTTVQPNVAAVQQPTVKTIASARPKRRSIRTFGDLINVVVAKVDKRKDKLIEFSSKDEDESLITGLNLGIVKVKKEEVIATNK